MDVNTLDITNRCWHPYWLIALACAITLPKCLKANNRMCRPGCTGSDCVHLWRPTPFLPISRALRHELNEQLCPDQYSLGRVQTVPIDWSVFSGAAEERVVQYLDSKLRSRAPQLEVIAPTDVLRQALLADILANG